MMSGATAGAGGAKGLVPAPAAGDQDKFLAGDGTFKAASSSGGDEVSFNGTAASDVDFDDDDDFADKVKAAFV